MDTDGGVDIDKFCAVMYKTLEDREQAKKEKRPPAVTNSDFNLMARYFMSIVQPKYTNTISKLYGKRESIRDWISNNPNQLEEAGKITKDADAVLDKTIDLILTLNPGDPEAGPQPDEIKKHINCRYWIKQADKACRIMEQYIARLTKRH